MTTSTPQTSVGAALLDELVAALRGTHLFETVAVGEEIGSQHRFPACVIQPGDGTTRRASSATRIHAHRVHLILAARSADAREDVRSLLNLRAEVEAELSGLVFSNVPGHFDTVIAAVTGVGVPKAAPFVKTTQVAVDLLTTEEA